MKVTAVAPANIAFIKYWGLKDPQCFFPCNGSLSMTLDSCLSTTTIELGDFSNDSIELDGSTLSPEQGDKAELIFKYLNYLREHFGRSEKLKVVSENNFPKESGIASSASGFAAFTVALLKAYGEETLLNNKEELSKLLRKSGALSAMRSLDGGFVELVNDEDPHIKQIADQDHWALVDIVVILSKTKKEVSSTEGHARAHSSPLFQTRLKELETRLPELKKALLAKDFSKLGPLLEEETLSMHGVMESSQPAIQYLSEASYRLMEQIKAWRSEGLEAYFTIDAGPNIHIIAEEKDLEALKSKLQDHELIINKLGAGPHFTNNHLF